jgi:ATP-dependent Clp protease ATP-binding subunit ClpC
MMFERFTDRARRVVVLAQEETRIAKAPTISTDFLLLALMREGEGVAAQVLVKMGVDETKLRELVAKRHEQETVEASHFSHIPFTLRSKKVLELALREALQLGHNYIGTEHILLGLVAAEADDTTGLVGPLLADLDIALPVVRKEVIAKLASYQQPERAPLARTSRIEVTQADQAITAAAKKIPESVTEILDEGCTEYVWQDKLLRYWKWVTRRAHRGPEVGNWTIYDEDTKKWTPSSSWPQTDGGWERVAPSQWSPEQEPPRPRWP